MTALPAARATVPLREVAGLYLELGKSRLSLLVVVTAVVGYLVAAPRPFDWGGLLWVTAGTFLLALGANALNQWLEVDRDALMERTRERPLPSQRMGRAHALAAANVMVVLGMLVLAAGNNALTAALGFANVAIYTLLYTPLKPVTPLNTLVGAICGAIPPMMGWTAAAGHLGPGAWILAGVLFVWQVPHSLALAYMYRDDYARGGYRMLPVVDGGRLTFHVVNLYCLALTPVALAATLFGLSGWYFGAGAIVLGAWMTWLGVRLWRAHGEREARRLFLATLVYLPVLLALMVVDRGPVHREHARGPVAAVSRSTAP